MHAPPSLRHDTPGLLTDGEEPRLSLLLCRVTGSLAKGSMPEEPPHLLDREKAPQVQKTLSIPGTDRLEGKHFRQSQQYSS